eukprot:TRINITY_DN259_c0_g1_i1.p1 TRINITY_DN259_c0_g1~~TRINITY_DN259_c0_g1_i1.p1  ORF type:complete len:496 (+),score=88.65 TRINITY_DN259_c0_g1_i1:148-1635(+)
MIDIFLTVIAAVVFVLLFGVCTYVLAYYSHPADNQENTFPKVIVVLALVLALSNVLLLPLDVASRNAGDGSLPMDYVWLYMYVIIALVGIFLIPFSIFYYEAEDEKGTSQVSEGLKWSGIIVVIFIVLLVVGYFFLAVSEVPITTLSATLQDGDRPPSLTECSPTVCGVAATTTTLSLHLNIFVWLVAVLAIGGWGLFALFGGIGLIALPFDLITSYLHRPLPITKETYNARKIKIGEETEALLQAGMKLTQRNSEMTRKERNEWKKHVYMIDREFVHNEIAYKKKGGAVIIYWAKLALGILSGIFAFMILLQMILWTNLSLYPFLDFMFIAMDGLWAFFGTIFFALIALLLIVTVVKGNFKFGLRIPFLMTMHPMKVGKTYQNSFLVNVVLILLASVSILHFLSQSFRLYVRGTAVNGIFNVAVNNLRGVSVYWVVMKWAIIGVMAAATLYFIIRPEEEKVKRYMKAQRANVSSKIDVARGKGQRAAVGGALLS